MWWAGQHGAAVVLCRWPRDWIRANRGVVRIAVKGVRGTWGIEQLRDYESINAGTFFRSGLGSWPVGFGQIHCLPKYDVQSVSRELIREARKYMPVSNS